MAYLFTNRGVEAVAAGEASLIASRATNDPWAIAGTMTALCPSRVAFSVDPQARDEAAEGVALAEEIGCPTLLHTLYSVRAYVEQWFDTEQAAYWARKSIDVAATSSGQAVNAGHAHATICLAAAGRGDRGLLLTSLRDAVTSARESAVWLPMYGACVYGGQALVQLGQPVLGVQLLGAAASHRTVPDAETDKRTQALAVARDLLDPAVYDRALRFTDGMNPDELSSFVLAEVERLAGG
jgi:hypothetical protein